MPKKKGKNADELSEEDKLNKRVDAMMDPKLPDPPAAKRATPPPLDIFKDAPDAVAAANSAKSAKSSGPATSAPEVSGKLLDKVDDVKETLTPNLKPPPQPTPKKPEPPAPKPPESPVDPPKDPIGQEDPLDDKTTDEAVTDIASKEGDTLLELQDALGNKATRTAGRLAQQDRRHALHRRWAWAIFVVIFVIVVLMALPYNSYTCRWPVGIRLSVTTDILPSVCK